MDNFFTRMFQRRETLAQAPGSTVPSSTTTAAASEQTGSGGTYEEKIIRVGNPQLALTISAVYRAVELKAKTLGQMEMQYQVKNREGGNFVPDMWKWGSRHSDGRIFNYLLQKRPNPMMTASELFQQMSIHRELLGNAFVYIERDEYDMPKNLWMAVCGGYNPVTGTYTISYNSDRGLVSRFQAPMRDVIHWRNTFRHSEGWMGLPTHVYAIQTLSLIATQKSQAMENAAKGGRVKLLIGEERQQQGGGGTLAWGMYNKEQMQKYADEINDRIYAKDVVALRGLEKVQSISMTAQDMQMMEMLNMGQDDVARYYGTPRPLLMLDTNSHYNDYTNATMEYHQRTIAPLARELEDIFDAKFLTMDDFGERRFHLCEQPLMRMDMEKQAKIDQLHLQTGVKNVNELRNQYDLPTVEKGDIHYISTNVAELGSEKLSGAVSTPQPAPTTVPGASASDEKQPNGGQQTEEGEP